MNIVKYSERVHMARTHELASATPPYERPGLEHSKLLNMGKHSIFQQCKVNGTISWVYNNFPYSIV